jgi:23S rRNA (guanine2445-N2)-methyltransferase / 23S rRNA (guanine2069-N7)-methyltransferase
VSDIRYFASCPKGLELLLVDELKALGAQDVREQLAGVRFAGDVTLGYRASLWSRLASRILMPLAEFDAADGDALYAGARTVDWSQHLGSTGSLAIDAHGHTSGLNHAQYASQRVKDAIVDQFREATGERPNVERDQPDIRVNLLLRRERATLSLDFAGSALFQRGWRRAQGEAPLKENLAAAMLMRARWPEIYAAGGALVDPMCGAGSLLIEGAWMVADIAPGLMRDYYGFLRWRGFSPEIWDELKREAQTRADEGLRQLRPVFYGFDQDRNVLQAARQNVQWAMVAGFVRLEPQAMEHIERPAGAERGLVISNPPYGERMGEVEELVPTYRALGDRLKKQFAGWQAAIITNQPDLGAATGLRAERKYQLFNGALECVLYCFDEIRAPSTEPRVEKALSEGAQSLVNRLHKNLRHLKSWRKRDDIHAFRAYDADMPEYAAAIDVYESTTGETWAHVQEYAPPDDIPEETARRRLGEIVRATGLELAIPRERIALKTRRPQTRASRYQRHETRGQFFDVEEGGLRFEVNLFDYLDTGLFLDHRPLRARIREIARGKRFLNLFAYTSTVSVYAASGGAATTTSVDLSGTYLEWASRNFALNGLAGARHQLVQADVMAWLAAEREQYDLIFVDPPTFSNSKRAEDFDVQREHANLLRLCGERLAPGGLILFSNNFRRFKIDAPALAQFTIREITRQTVPPDFARDQRIHHVFELRHAEQSGTATGGSAPRADDGNAG